MHVLVIITSTRISQFFGLRRRSCVMNREHTTSAGSATKQRYSNIRALYAHLGDGHKDVWYGANERGVTSTQISSYKRKTKQRWPLRKFRPSHTTGKMLILGTYLLEFVPRINRRVYKKLRWWYFRRFHDRAKLITSKNLHLMTELIKNYT